MSCGMLIHAATWLYLGAGEVSVKDPAKLNVARFQRISSFLEVVVGLLLGFFLSSSMQRLEMHGNAWKCKEMVWNARKSKFKSVKEMSKTATSMFHSKVLDCFRCFGVLQVVQLHERLLGAFRCHPRLTHAAECYGSRKGSCLRFLIYTISF